MSLIAIVHVAHPDFALSPTIRNCPDVGLRVMPQSATDPETGLFFFFVENSTESFEAALEADHTVTEWTAVANGETGAVYRMQHPSDAKLLSPKTLELGGLMLEAMSDETGWTIHLQFPNQEALSKLWEYCEDEGFSFELKRMFRHQPWTTSRGLSLTDAQREALTTAYEQGYFEEPRAISLAELADILDISPTAVGGRIRRGTAELIGTTMMQE
ncbi:MAG TPA: helix-turn-helix domain-containing protein [Halococcus sp.]|nr:helix-turn-helix domain-containing protein [Halococcus sp.]